MAVAKDGACCGGDAGSTQIPEMHSSAGLIWTSAIAPAIRSPMTSGWPDGAYKERASMSFHDEDFLERELMKIRRCLSRSNVRIIAGVCAGLAGFIGWQPVSLRALFVLGVILSFGWFGVMYLLL